MSTVPRFLAFAFSVGLSAPAFSQSVRLNAPLAGGHVHEVSFTSDGRRVVYVADQDQSGVLELYSVGPRRREPPVKLNAPLPANGDVSGFFESGGGRVIYRASQDTAGLIELYSVPEDGSAAPVKLSPPIAVGGLVGSYSIAPDASRVVMHSRPAAAAPLELYSAPLAGGAAPLRLDGPTVPGGGASGFEISADSTFVVYRADQEVTGRYELFRVPILAGASAVKVSGTLPAGTRVNHFRITADGTRVVYRVSGGSIEQLYSGPSDASAIPIRLDAASGTGRVTGNFSLSADGALSAFRADQQVAGVYQLFVVPTDGSVPPLDVSAGENVYSAPAISIVQFTPDGARIVYVVQVGSRLELRSVRADGSAAPVALNAPFGPSGGLAGFSTPGYFAISADSSRVVFYARQTGTSPVRMLAAPVDGSAAPVDPAPPGGNVLVTEYLLSPDGARVVLQRSANGERRYFECRLAGAPLPRAFSSPFGGSLFDGAALSPDGGQFVHLGDVLTEDRTEVFLALPERTPSAAGQN